MVIGYSRNRLDNMTLDDWYTAAREDVDRRGLPDMKPLIDALQQATRQLRDADWNDDARGGS
jgi:hypothetical protein